MRNDRIRGDPRSIQAQRRGLLAKIHMAKKDLALSDADYQHVLVRVLKFRTITAAALSIREMEELVRYFISRGWRPNRQSSIVNRQSQILALQERIRNAAAGLESSRLKGLSRSVCSVDVPEWCKDVRKLKRLLVIVQKIVREER